VSATARLQLRHCEITVSPTRVDPYMKASYNTVMSACSHDRCSAGSGSHSGVHNGGYDSSPKLQSSKLHGCQVAFSRRLQSHAETADQNQVPSSDAFGGVLDTRGSQCNIGNRGSDVGGSCGSDQWQENTSRDLGPLSRSMDACSGGSDQRQENNSKELGPLSRSMAGCSGGSGQRQENSSRDLGPRSRSMSGCSGGRAQRQDNNSKDLGLLFGVMEMKAVSLSSGVSLKAAAVTRRLAAADASKSKMLLSRSARRRNYRYKRWQKGLSGSCSLIQSLDLASTMYNSSGDESGWSEHSDGSTQSLHDLSVPQFPSAETTARFLCQGLPKLVAAVNGVGKTVSHTGLCATDPTSLSQCAQYFTLAGTGDEQDYLDTYSHDVFGFSGGVLACGEQLHSSGSSSGLVQVHLDPQGSEDIPKQKSSEHKSDSSRFGRTCELSATHAHDLVQPCSPYVDVGIAEDKNADVKSAGIPLFHSSRGAHTYVQPGILNSSGSAGSSVCDGIQRCSDNDKLFEWNAQAPEFVPCCSKIVEGRSNQDTESSFQMRSSAPANLHQRDLLRLEGEVAEQDVVTWICNECDMHNPGYSLYCVKCWNSCHGAVTCTSENQAECNDDYDHGHIRKCPVCEFPNDVDDLMCADCGYPTVGISSDVPEICPFCDTIDFTGDRFCEVCMRTWNSDNDIDDSSRNNSSKQSNSSAHARSGAIANLREPPSADWPLHLWYEMYTMTRKVIAEELEDARGERSSRIEQATQLKVDAFWEAFACEMLLGGCCCDTFLYAILDLLEGRAVPAAVVPDALQSRVLEWRRQVLLACDPLDEMD